MAEIDKVVGFLGCGEMGEAILGGLVKFNLVSPQNIYVCNRTKNTMDRLIATYGVKSASATDLARLCDVIFVGVKPSSATAVLDTISNDLDSRKLVVSMAAGVNIDTLERHLPHNQPLVRVMPSIPCIVGAGVTSVAPNKSATKDDVDMVLKIFRQMGSAIVMTEAQIHTVIGVAGSSNAYSFLFLESLADGAVHGGLPREQANFMAAQSVMGAAMMVLETGQSPGELKDLITAQPGTTIEAVSYLEASKFRSSVIEAANAASEKSKEMERSFQE